MVAIFNSHSVDSDHGQLDSLVLMLENFPNISASTKTQRNVLKLYEEMPVSKRKAYLGELKQGRNDMYGHRETLEEVVARQTRLHQLRLPALVQN